MPSVYLDESGNTGANLLDIEQPIFSLSSNIYSDEQAAELLSKLGSQQGEAEIKFSSLKRSRAGRARLVDFFRSELLIGDYVKTSIFHKDFMIVTKIVDMLFENFAHANGVDLYKDGANIAMSNMLYICLPNSCSEDTLKSFKESFITMVRVRSEESIEGFYNSASELHEARTSDLLVDELLIIKNYPRDLLDLALTNDASYNLDPAIPALFMHCHEWGMAIGEFDVIHDASKPIANSIDFFNRFMDDQQETVVAGYDRRTFELPLKASGISFADSRAVSQVQVSDIIAGATVYCAKSKISQEENELTRVLDILFEESNILLSPIWPTTAITPDDLGTNIGGGSNPAAATAEFLRSTFN